MVNIKGLDKEKVVEALKNEVNRRMAEPGMYRPVFGGEISLGQFCKRATVDLNGDEFDERQYDKVFGESAAQRAVDSVRAELEGGGEAAGNTDGGKKELFDEEKVKRVKEAIKEIIDILAELSPEESLAVIMFLKMTLMGPMGGIAGMMPCGPFAPRFPFKGRFG